MTYVIAQDGTAYGPFTTVQVLADRLACDAVVLPLSVIGTFTTTQVPPAPTAAEAARASAALQKQIEDAVDARMNKFAATRGYASMASLASYAGDPDPQFNSEGTYGKGARSQTYRALYNILAQVQAGNWPATGANQQPTGYADIERSLPVLAWPA